MTERERPLIDGAIEIPCDNNFFKWWLEFLKPVHHLTDRQMDVVAAFLKRRYALTQKITDTALVDKILMSQEMKTEVREECSMSLSQFRVLLSTLKQKKIIVDDKINLKYVPNIQKGISDFRLLLVFRDDFGKYTA